MKSIITAFFALVAVAFITGFSGCTSESIQVIHNDKVVTNNVPLKAFNDEMYVWENWTFSTNKADIIEK